MASSTVTALTAATQPLTGSELVYIVQSGSDTKSTTFAIASAGILDPIATYNAAGVKTTTTGTISSGANTLVVASATGWSIGMGIAVANAGAGGNTELITSVTVINGTTFTLAANAISTATGQTVNHDDTAAIQAAVNAVSASLQRLHIRAGNYNVTSEITLAAPIFITGDGAVDNLTKSLPQQSATGGTVIWNRGKTNNVFNISSGYVQIRDLTIQQAAGITPTAGFAITIGHASVYCYNVILENNYVYGTYGGMALTGFVTAGFIRGNRVTSLVTAAIKVDNAVPAGGNHFVDNTFTTLNSSGAVLVILQADIHQWTHNGFANGNPGIQIVNGIGQTFVNNSIENGSNTGQLILIQGGQGITFIGGEVGQDNARGGFYLTGGSNISIMGVDFNAVTGTPIAVSGATDVNILGNVSSQGTPAITNMVSGVAAVSFTGTPSASFTVTNGIVTHS